MYFNLSYFQSRIFNLCKQITMRVEQTKDTYHFKKLISLLLNMTEVTRKRVVFREIHPADDGMSTKKKKLGSQPDDP